MGFFVSKMANHKTDGDSTAQAERWERILPAVTERLFQDDAAHPLSGLPAAQMRLCDLLYMAGRRTMSNIADDLGISVSAVTQVADRLERAGLVERTPDPGGDRRTRFLQLTPHGKMLMDTRAEQRRRRILSALTALQADQRETTLSALETLADGFAP